MSKYEIEELGRLWRLQKLTIEQAVGQLTLHAQEMAQTLPVQREAVLAFQKRFYGVVQDVAKLKEGRLSQ